VIFSEPTNNTFIMTTTLPIAGGAFLAMSQPDPEDRKQAMAAPAEAVSSRARKVPDADRWQGYSGEQKAAALSIDARRNKLELSLSAFCDFSNLTETVWSKVAGGTYKGDIAAKIAEAGKQIEILEASVKRRKKRATVPFVFHEWVDVLALREAVANAFDSATEVQEGRHGERISIVDYVAPFGWGKSEMIGDLMRRFGGTKVEALEGWKGSRRAAYESIAEQLGVPAPQKKVISGGTRRKPEFELEDRAWRSAAECERSIIAWLTAHPRVLYFSEIELCDTALCNLWKEISNWTRCVVVRFALPEFYVHMLKRTGVYGAQVNSRTEMVLPASRIPSSLVRSLFADHAPRLQLADKTAELMAAYCTELGGNRAVIGTAKLMDADKSITESPTFTKIEAHVLTWRSHHRLAVREIPADMAGFVPVAKFPRLA
jgi:hypothetical protein